MQFLCTLLRHNTMFSIFVLHQSYQVLYIVYSIDAEIVGTILWHVRRLLVCSFFLSLPLCISFSGERCDG